MKQRTATLLMVYNADSGIFNALTDAVRKTVSPDTYECSLCAVTYGMVSMRRDWRKFLDRLPVEKKFYHRDDFSRDYPDRPIPLPAILLDRGDRDPATLVGSEELGRITDLSELIELTQTRLMRNGLAPTH
ncbi:hypothetical protein [Qipengyuania qiaonensis]|uniref:GTPase n=1 Tax=Qipengyuania qiaonensis TaxID=2867240 RepID=A0ABS7JCL5_9SPHN|nr:hypothetical protein [Qipengyuania qiaonensis]MBX7483418.1 hypothetical protein [Qipengyuania qiaonensis]